jgi:RNA polymerase sigma-70 factor (ECF subfamily)
MINDRELALRSRSGDREAFGELVRRYQASVFNVCYRLTGERSEAEDLAQEAFLRAYQRFSQYDLERPFGPWMRRVAANVCLNQLQSMKDAELRPLEIALDDDQDYARCETLPSSWQPEKMQEQVEKAEAVRAAIISLPPHHRVVIELRHFQGLSYEEIAQALQIPLSDVKSYLFRARHALVKKLEPYAS